MICDVKDVLPQIGRVVELNMHTKPAIAGILFLHFSHAYSIVAVL